ncbi:copper chaperone PCu(A)C [Modestobacter sp. SYSU DS0657]
MNRAPRVAVMGALLLSPIALTACGTGQVAQTAEQERDHVGTMASAGDLRLRALNLAYPPGGTYSSGSDARLVGAIASSGNTEDTLVSIEGDAFDGVEVADPSAAAPAADASGSDELDLTVPAQGILFLTSGDGPTITLTGLDDELGVGQHIDVTFVFEEAGEVTVPVPVDNPPRDLPRGEAFDWHHEEEGSGSGSGTGGGGSHASDPEPGSEPTEPGSESSESADE